jgi:hypothetical protein
MSDAADAVLIMHERLIEDADLPRGRNANFEDAGNG